MFWFWIQKPNQFLTLHVLEIHNKFWPLARTEVCKKRRFGPPKHFVNKNRIILIFFFHVPFREDGTNFPGFPTPIFPSPSEYKFRCPENAMSRWRPYRCLRAFGGGARAAPKNIFLVFYLSRIEWGFSKFLFPFLRENIVLRGIKKPFSLFFLLLGTFGYEICAALSGVFYLRKMSFINGV